MAEPTFTPGPWTAHTFMVKAGHDKICQTGYSSSLGPSRSDEAAANATLIAAAPEEDAALLAAVMWWESIEALRDASERAISFGLDYEPGWLKEARGALAKARGEG